MSGQLNAVILFTILIFGFGYSVLWLTRAKTAKHPLLYLIELAGVGFATFSFLGVVLHLLHIPLHILVYLVLALVCPFVDLILNWKKKRQKWNFSLDRTTYCVIGLAGIMLFTFLVFHKGAFIYPYLENDDPWNHALSAHYIAEQYTYAIDPAVGELSPGYTKYLEPYPPTYGILMGIMRQVNDSMYWTLKFFNVLFITIGLAFYFLLFRTYLKDDIKAIFGTFLLAALPSFMSHFIWSQTLALVIFPIALYATLKALNERSWRIPAIILVASMMVTQPVVSFVFGLVFTGLVVLLFFHEYPRTKGPFLKRIPQTTNAFIVGAFGLLVSFLYWGAQIIKWGLGGIASQRSGELTTGWGGAYALQKYALRDIIFAPHSSKIDQAIGWGPVITFLVVLSVIALFLTRKKTFAVKKHWHYMHTFIWFCILFYAVFAPSFGLSGWGSARSWAYLALPVVLLATEGTFILLTSFTKKEKIQLGVLIALAIGIAFTSVPAKVAVQTATWPPGAQWTFAAVNGQPTYVELAGYVQMMQTLPKQTRVFVICDADHRAVGFDMASDPWSYDVGYFRRTIANATEEEIVAFMELHKFEYLTLDATCPRSIGQNETIALAERLTNTKRFQPVINPQGFLLAKFI